MLRSMLVFLKKNTFSFRGLAVIIAIPFIILTSQLSDILEYWEGEVYASYSLTLVQLGLEDRAMLLLFPVLCALPGAAAYLEDRKCGIYRFVLSRTKRRTYVTARCLSCGLSGGLSMVLGILLSCVISFAVFGGLDLSGDTEELTTALQEVLKLTGLYFLSGFFWSLFGMQLSIITKSRYVACLAPFAAYYILQMLQQRYFKKVKLINPESWIVPFRYEFWEQNGLVALFVGVLCLGLFFILYYSCRRDLKNV